MNVKLQHTNTHATLHDFVFLCSDFEDLSPDFADLCTLKAYVADFDQRGDNDFSVPMRKSNYISHKQGDRFKRFAPTATVRVLVLMLH